MIALVFLNLMDILLFCPGSCCDEKKTSEARCFVQNLSGLRSLERLGSTEEGFHMFVNLILCGPRVLYSWIALVQVVKARRDHTRREDCASWSDCARPKGIVVTLR